MGIVDDPAWWRMQQRLRAEQCTWFDCHEPRHAEDSPPLCTNHLIRCAVYMANKMQVEIVNPGREGYYTPRAEQAHRDHANGDSVVYYVRIGDHVKIGTSTNLKKRLKTFYVDADALLATEPGDRDLEQMRHQQFNAERVYRNRELFNPSRRLLAHIESLNAEAA